MSNKGVNFPYKGRYIIVKDHDDGVQKRLKFNKNELQNTIRLNTKYGRCLIKTFA